MPSWLFFGYLLFGAFDELQDSNSVTRNMNLDIRETSYILCLRLFFHGYPCKSPENNVTVPVEIKIGDSLI